MHGQNDVALGEDWMRGILSGDPSKISKLLGPQIEGIRNREQQKLQTASQFGDRSGGTNAFLQQTGDDATAAINRMIDELTQSAVSGITTLGTHLTDSGMSGYGRLFDEATTMQQQNQAKWGDIFKSISDVATGAMGGAGL